MQLTANSSVSVSGRKLGTSMQTKRYPTVITQATQVYTSSTCTDSTLYSLVGFPACSAHAVDPPASREGWPGHSTQVCWEVKATSLGGGGGVTLAFWSGTYVNVSPCQSHKQAVRVMIIAQRRCRACSAEDHHDHNTVSATASTEVCSTLDVSTNHSHAHYCS